MKVVRGSVAAIREKDPGRLIIADGLNYGRDPVPELSELKIGQSTRGYDPFTLTHFKANWVKGSDQWASPTWPLNAGGKDEWTRERLRRERIEPWKKLEAQGVGVHVGEWGFFNQTPHAVGPAWMRDAGPVEKGRLGLVVVEPARGVWRARQRTQRRRLRGVQGTQTRPPDAGATAEN